ncbi:MAG: pyridoxamine 5'-phosphate oxidase family protein [Pyrinomonadaceae bacterium]
MSNENSKRKLTAAAVLFLLFFTLPAFAQQSTFSRDALISAAREIMTTTRYCALITTGRNGRSHARTMDAFAPEADMTVWLATNPRSRKATEIRRNPKVTLYYFDRESAAYVTIYGIARLVTEKTEKARRWKDDWKAFYPDRDKSYLLIKVTPERLEVVNINKGVVGTSPTWQPLSVDFRRH